MKKGIKIEVREFAMGKAVEVQIKNLSKREAIEAMEHTLQGMKDDDGEHVKFGGSKENVELVKMMKKILDPEEQEKLRNGLSEKGKLIWDNPDNPFKGIDSPEKALDLLKSILAEEDIDIEKYKKNPPKTEA